MLDPTELPEYNADPPPPIDVVAAVTLRGDSPEDPPVFASPGVVSCVWRRAARGAHAETHHDTPPPRLGNVAPRRRHRASRRRRSRPSRRPMRLASPATEHAAPAAIEGGPSGFRRACQAGSGSGHHWQFGQCHSVSGALRASAWRNDGALIAGRSLSARNPRQSSPRRRT